MFERLASDLSGQLSGLCSNLISWCHPTGGAPLEKLPPELLQRVGLCSHNANLVLVSKTIRAKLSSAFFQTELVKQDLHTNHHFEFPPPTSIVYFGDNTSYYVSFSEPRPDVSALPRKLVLQARKDYVLAHASAIGQLIYEDPERDSKNLEDFKAWLTEEPADTMPWPMVVSKFPRASNDPVTIQRLGGLLKIGVGKEWSVLINGRLQTPRSANDYYSLYCYGAFTDGTTEKQYFERD